MFLGIGTVFYCTVGGVIVTYFNTTTFYYLPMLNGICMFIIAFVYAEKKMDHPHEVVIKKHAKTLMAIFGQEANEAEEEEHGHHGHHEHMTLIQKLSFLKKVLEIPNVKKMTMFLFLITLTLPNMEVYLIYSNEHQKHISILFESGMISISVTITILLLIVYTSNSIKTPILTFQSVAFVA